MKKKSYYLIVFIVIAAISVLWMVRYVSINRQYADRTLMSDIYSIGDVIAFNQDYISWGFTANGYSIRADDFCIMEYDEVSQTFNVDDNSMQIPPPERIALVTVTLFNEDSNDAGVMLFELTLHGIDMYSDLNLELLDTLNPILDGAAGVTLASGTEYTLVLPYNLRKMHYSSSTWNNMYDREFWLQLTEFPTVKEIALQ